MLSNVLLTALSMVAVTSAAPTTQKLDSRAVNDRYIMYNGNGTPSQGWPMTSAWGTWDELWRVNEPLMRQSCGWNGWGADNSQTEINNIRNAIVQVSGETGVERRYILAIVMQESKGCVRAPVTNNGVRNPGLMQSHNGSGNCAGVNPCPNNQIVQMIRDGTAGTPHGDGLRQTLDKTRAATNDNGARHYYASARMYNSGSVDYNNLNNPFTATRCYSADIANRLTGWTLAASRC